jgi:mono/diheme cytochrome c family protein
MRDGSKILAHRPHRLLLGALLSLFAGTAIAGGIDRQDFSQIERGRYLTIVGDCAACHTLPGSGHELAGGRTIETPFGNLVAPNITPDPLTGVGAWTDDEFANALLKGTGRNGTHLYPAMPYTYYTKITRDDALAIRAYLDTVPAVQHAVKSNQLPFPVNIRASMAVWNKLFFHEGRFIPVAGKSDQWNRGAYLTEGLGHCGMCHTPKNFLGADDTTKRLHGYSLQGWFAPDITNDPRRGLGGWSVEDIVAYLETGHNKTAAATGPMSETLNLSTSKMSEADLHAIAGYLKDQSGPDRNRTAQGDPDTAVMKAGAQIYADECSGCHTADGKGIAGLFPSLNGAAVVQQTDPTTLMHVVLRGALSVATAKAPTGPAMPEFGWLLKDDQVAAVLTYIRNAWGNSAPAVNAAEVSKARHLFIERSD